MEEKRGMCIMMGRTVKSLHQVSMELYLKIPIISRPPMGFKMQLAYGIPRQRGLTILKAMEEIKTIANKFHRLP
jgi:hypothetical protein